MKNGNNGGGQGPIGWITKTKPKVEHVLRDLLAPEGLAGVFRGFSRGPNRGTVLLGLSEYPVNTYK